MSATVGDRQEQPRQARPPVEYAPVCVRTLARQQTPAVRLRGGHMVAVQRTLAEEAGLVSDAFTGQAPAAEACNSADTARSHSDEDSRAGHGLDRPARSGAGRSGGPAAGSRCCETPDPLLEGGLVCHTLPGLGTDENNAIEPWKMNLMAVSPAGDMLFVALGSEVLTYSLHRHVRGPCLLTRLVTGSPRNMPINQIKCGYVGVQPVLVTVDDAAEVRVFFLNDAMNAVDQAETKTEGDSTPVLRGRPLYIHNPAGQGTWGVAMCPQTRTVAVSANSHTVTVFRLDVASRVDHVGLIGHDHNIPCIAFSPSGKYIASASIDTSVAVWDVSLDGTKVCSARPSAEWGWSVCWIPKSQVADVSGTVEAVSRAGAWHAIAGPAGYGTATGAGVGPGRAGTGIPFAPWGLIAQLFGRLLGTAGIGEDADVSEPESEEEGDVTEEEDREEDEASDGSSAAAGSDDLAESEWDAEASALESWGSSAQAADRGSASGAGSGEVASGEPALSHAVAPGEGEDGGAAGDAAGLAVPREFEGTPASASRGASRGARSHSGLKRAREAEDDGSGSNVTGARMHSASEDGMPASASARAEAEPAGQTARGAGEPAAVDDLESSLVAYGSFSDLFLLEPRTLRTAAHLQSVVPDDVPRVHVLMGMARISMMEWIPELSLLACASQGRCRVVLVRVVRCMPSGKYALVREAVLPPRMQQLGAPVVGMCVVKRDPLPSADGLGAGPTFQLLVLFLNNHLYCYELSAASDCCVTGTPMHYSRRVRATPTPSRG